MPIENKNMRSSSHSTFTLLCQLWFICGLFGLIQSTDQILNLSKGHVLLDRDIIFEDNLSIVILLLLKPQFLYFLLEKCFLLKLHLLYNMIVARFIDLLVRFALIVPVCLLNLIKVLLKLYYNPSTHDSII